MKYLIAGVEGKVSEGAGIAGVLTALRQQSPRGYQHLEVVPLPLEGNHGHGQKLIKKFSDTVTDYINNPNNCVEQSDTILKRLVCDYDNMTDHGIDEAMFRDSVLKIDAIPIISKPCFEYFPARLLVEKEELDRMLNAGYHINYILRMGINRYNNTQKLDLLKLKPYSKRTHSALEWFSTLFSQDPEFLERAKNMEANPNSDYYTEMPKLIREIAENFENTISPPPHASPSPPPQA